MNRTTLRGSLLLIVLTAASALPNISQSVAADAPPQEYYELRVYRVEDADRHQIVSGYLEHALLPALGRIGIDRVGVFTRMDDPEDHAIYMLIPFKSLDDFTSLNAALEGDEGYQSAAAEYFSLPQKTPPYTRIESKFMKAFAGIPVIEEPSQTAARTPRLFELRTYESHNEQMARRKVEMFNEGEIQVMRDVGLAPVFYGETLIGADVPNLTYMLSAGDMPSHQEHWAAFRVHPGWKKMQAMERYKGTVSNINKWMLIPTAYSQL